MSTTPERALARNGLSAVCPLLTLALDVRGRLEEEVDTQLARGGWRAGLSEWGREFTERLAGDEDRLVAQLAAFEWLSLTPA